jgi:hypothetical protein
MIFYFLLINIPTLPALFLSSVFADENTKKYRQDALVIPKIKKFLLLAMHNTKN